MNCEHIMCCTIVQFTCEMQLKTRNAIIPIETRIVEMIFFISRAY